MAARLILAASLLVVVTACADLDATPIAGQPAAPIGSPAAGPAATAARAAVFEALGRANLIVADTVTPFRPPEAGPLAAAPRNVYQVTLPRDPGEGFIVVYELPSEGDARAAAEAQREYLASGPGRVQSPPGTDHVIQQLGSALIVYDWLPADAQDPNAPRVAEALRTIGTPFAVAP
ncbi:MAG TPA: hypothetical protein VFU17_04505 [Candidatus Limnocylindrales bacterium]|nr:hypothetical protein [Candidatus Limnocylindrales bacterium]